MDELRDGEMIEVRVPSLLLPFVWLDPPLLAELLD
jgi:hypothetical protein